MESSTPSDCEVRAASKFLNVGGVSGLEIHKLNNVYGAGNVSPFVIFTNGLSILMLARVTCMTSNKLVVGLPGEND